MHKRLLILLSVLLVGGGLIWLIRWNNGREVRLPAASDKDRARAAARLNPNLPKQPEVIASVPIAPSRPVRLAIGWLGLPDERQNLQVTDLLTAGLTGTKGLELVDRQSLDKVLAELEMRLSGLVRAKDAVRVGKLLRADWFLLGTETTINGSNAVVVRVVNARTGIMQDTAYFRGQQSPGALAAELAGFVRQCRQAASQPRPRVYLAIGAFEDLSLNNRLADLPAQLGAYLTLAYRGTNITVLEREYVDVLLQEMRLDLAGLTDNSTTNAGAVMQMAFWLVDGDYQTYDTSQAGVEVVLRIHRIFGRRTTATVRAAPGEALFRSVRSALDQAIYQRQAVVVPTWVSETRAQMARGKELGPDVTSLFGEPYVELNAQQARLLRRNTEEAIRAFKTVLLLDPTNREARVYLGGCYCRAVVGRTEEGRQTYREVLEEGVQDRWHDAAARCLILSFNWSSAEQRLQWFSTAEGQTGNSSLKPFYHNQVEDARSTLRLHGADRSQGRALAEQRLFEAVRSSEQVLLGKSGTSGGAFGMYHYIDWFGADKVNAERSLAEILPRLASAFPSLAPHLTAEALQFQSQTNNPVVPEFHRHLEWCRAHPAQVFALSDFWSSARYAAYSWCMEHGEPALAVDIMEGLRQTAQYTNKVAFENDDKIALAFAYKATRQWREALAIFECFSNLPIVMNCGDGPWGKAFAPVLTAKEATYCREKLGFRPTSDPREFDMGTNCLCMHSLSAFAADPEGLWVAMGGQLMHLDFDLRTNLVQFLPKDSWSGINCVLVGSSNVWIGTDGSGLVEFNKVSRQTTRYTEQDGLMTDVVRTLHLSGDTLWIGYGEKEGPAGFVIADAGGGGLGRLNLSRRQFLAFSPSLDGGTEAAKDLRVREPSDRPTRRTVRGIAIGPEQDIWFSAWGSPLRRYRPADNTWEAFPDVPCVTLLADSERLFVGGFSNYLQPPQAGPLGVSILAFSGHAWSKLNDFGVLPAGMVSALARDGEHLWVGGSGYIAKIDPLRNELLRFSPIRSTVDRIQIAGGYLWAQYDRHLHRARVP
jgi:hypothetical protein